jgi:hypothetical protein
MKEKLVSEYGPLWARNSKNLRRLKTRVGDSIGFYLLYCGWFPVYIGHGKLYSRIWKHTRSHSKVWDRFTWFKLADPSRSPEMEAVFLRSLPFFLRLNNRQGAHLPVHSTKEEDRAPDLLSMPKMTPKRKSRKTRS